MPTDPTPQAPKKLEYLGVAERTVAGMAKQRDALQVQVGALTTKLAAAIDEAVNAHRAWLRVSDELDDAHDLAERYREALERIVNGESVFAPEIARQALQEQSE